ncbi:unnamed protein product [Aureobasidium mustum]|uniref:Uncharacterized protein n=1 Tax=Aureobasidium mustum TaxID=2773714 RepID=A0A9N8JK82_9PEZI|nr:unnamed protein product [Aureobasidium mustum]
MTAIPDSQPQVREQLSDKDNTVMCGAGYALVTVLLLWLDWSGLPTDTSFDSATRWIGSFCLLIACLVLLGFNVAALGKATLPDDHDKGTSRAFTGALVTILVAIGYALLSHCLDDKIFLYKLFWVQVPTLPGAYIAAKFLGKEMDGRRELKTLCGYGLVDLLLWIYLHNMDGRTNPQTEDELWAFMGFLLGLFVLLIANLVLLIMNLENVVEARVEEIPNGRVLITLGAFIGIGIMILGVMVPLELAFHILDGKHWMYQILLAVQGALPGAYLIGGSAWLAKAYAGQKSEYSTIYTEEGQP